MIGATINYMGQEWKVIEEVWHGNMNLLTLTNGKQTIKEWHYMIQYGIKRRG